MDEAKQIDESFTESLHDSESQGKKYVQLVPIIVQIITNPPLNFAISKYF